jgi:hypothetical protein
MSQVPGSHEKGLRFFTPVKEAKRRNKLRIVQNLTIIWIEWESESYIIFPENSNRGSYRAKDLPL